MRSIVFAILIFLCAPALAVQPDEMLADPALEARARAVSGLIRCPVCQGETIDDSNATIAKDLRLVVRERLLEGDSDDQVIDYVVARYGEFVLFQPRAEGINWLLWGAGPMFLAMSLAAAGLYLRRRERAPEDFAQPLNAEERERLDQIIGG
jgi:cytochrome c-type biogenesis protein CcmH